MPTLDTYTPDKLLAGDAPLHPYEVTIASGAGVLTRGAVLGKITTGGKCVLVDSTNADGSQAPYGVLAEDVDATSADVITVAYLSGDFNEAALTFGGTDDADTHREALRALNIYLRTAA